MAIPITKAATIGDTAAGGGVAIDGGEVAFSVVELADAFDSPLLAAFIEPKQGRDVGCRCRGLSPRGRHWRRQLLLEGASQGDRRWGRKRRNTCAPQGLFTHSWIRTWIRKSRTYGGTGQAAARCKHHDRAAGGPAADRAR